jgi:hypothetical protein
LRLLADMGSGIVELLEGFVGRGLGVGDVKREDEGGARE